MAGRGASIALGPLGLVSSPSLNHADAAAVAVAVGRAVSARSDSVTLSAASDNKIFDRDIGTQTVGQPARGRGHGEGRRESPIISDRGRSRWGARLGGDERLRWSKMRRGPGRIAHLHVLPRSALYEVRAQLLKVCPGNFSNQLRTTRGIRWTE